MFNSHSYRSRRGFTLVELIIVIGIITALTAIAVVAYTNVQKQSRDSQRSTDVTAIMDALERYYDKNGEYPTNDEMNTTNSPTVMTSMTPTKTLMPTLTDDDLNGPNGSQFYAGCINTSCTNTSANWGTYHSKQYVYSSRLVASQSGSNVWFGMGSTYGSGTGWGCTITTYYDNPGYFIAWRSEATGIWTFKRSKHGTVTIAAFDASNPVAPQTCTFS
jgi:prepilin-type N-terminal cleavage/methylation domain-containing protein